MNRRNLNTLICSAAVLALSARPLLLAQAKADEDGEEPYRIALEDVRKVRRKYQRREVAFQTNESPGTVIVDPQSKFLYFTLGSERAIRYGVGVGRQGFEWSGDAVIRRKAKWPRWTPPKEMVARDPLAAKWAEGMPGGPQNPLGARALYLFQGDVDTLYRIHGTFLPESIGTAVSSGCIRMINADVADLYERVRVGAKVIVLSEPAHIAEDTSRRKRTSLFDWLR